MIDYYSLKFINFALFCKQQQRNLPDVIRVHEVVCPFVATCPSGLGSVPQAGQR